MTDLIKRMEEAEAGSRELDIALAMETTHVYGFDSEREIDAYPHPTTSIDDALALAERVLPRLYMWNVEFDDEPTATPASAKVYAEQDGRGYAATPALALCIAVLKAADTGREG
jgi:hypothetical protein